MSQNDSKDTLEEDLDRLYGKRELIAQIFYQESFTSESLYYFVYF